MFKNRYLTTQLMVETKKIKIRRRVVMFTVRVRLVDSRVNIHVGKVMVAKVMIQ